MLWVLFTVLAAAGQTARNAMQRELVAALGTVGATHVRFLFGFPFALVFLAGVLAATGLPLPRVPLAFWPWVLLGAGAQILATALMLATMNDRSFVVTIAYIKTEAVQAALFGLVFLGDRLTFGMAVAILIATAGVVVMSLKGRGAAEGGLRPVLLGLAAGAMFALSAVGYRGAILSLALPSFVLAATFTLTVGLVLQAGLLTLYLAWRGRAVLVAIVRSWRPSLFAGFMGATASEFWFLAFALTSVANVRTLGAGRSPVRPGDIVLRVQASNDRARGRRHGADRRRCRAADLGAVTGARRPRSVALVGHDRQRVEFDALVEQLLGVLRRRLAVDRAVLDLAVVHLARLFGKFAADVVGVLDEMVAQFLELGAELALLRRHHGDRRLGLGCSAPRPAVLATRPPAHRRPFGCRGRATAP